jgi:putative chitinase
MKYFTISELTRSDTASIKKIDNTPNKEITEHLIELVEKLLDPLRSAWAEYCDDNQLGNAGIRISSGFRNKELNKAVGGSSTSAHLTGYAADISPINGNMKVFQSWIAEAIEEFDFDQLIYERPRNGIAS